MIEEVIKKRHSVRNFKGWSFVDEDLINKAVEIAESAPSAGGLRAYTVFVSKEHSEIEKLAECAYHQMWISRASIVFVICIDPLRSGKRYKNRGEKLYCIQDATLHGAYLDLLFVEKGYGTCWVGAINGKKVREFLKLPKHLIPISYLVVGKENVVK